VFQLKRSCFHICLENISVHIYCNKKKYSHTKCIHSKILGKGIDFKGNIAAITTIKKKNMALEYLTVILPVTNILSIENKTAGCYVRVT
jgi:hypothetical protein